MSDRGRSAAYARKQLDRRLAALRDTGALARPQKGWLKAIRDALGMTMRQMAVRARISQPSVAAWEKSEAHESITLGKLREAAEALDCELVYALVPRKPLQDMVEERARLLADSQLARTHHTMSLENQAVSGKALTEERDRIVTELLAGNPGQLWEDR